MNFEKKEKKIETETFIFRTSEKENEKHWKYGEERDTKRHKTIYNKQFEIKSKKKQYMPKIITTLLEKINQFHNIFSPNKLNLKLYFFFFFYWISKLICE